MGSFGETARWEQASTFSLWSRTRRTGKQNRQTPWLAMGKESFFFAGYLYYKKLCIPKSKRDVCTTIQSSFFKWCVLIFSCRGARWWWSWMVGKWKRRITLIWIISLSSFTLWMFHCVLHVEPTGYHSGADHTLSHKQNETIKQISTVCINFSSVSCQRSMLINVYNLMKWRIWCGMIWSNKHSTEFHY